jgi:hypothetical protein
VGGAVGFGDGMVTDEGLISVQAGGLLSPLVEPKLSYSGDNKYGHNFPLPT